MVAEFPREHALLHAARGLRKAGYLRYDVQTPYPIHGMDEAMGLGRSKVSYCTLAGALTGFSIAVGLQYYAQAIDYPLITGGKPYASWPAWMVIMFELTVLFSAFGTVFGMIALNGLPNWYHPTLKHAPMLGATDNRFFMVVDATDVLFHEERTRALLLELGGRNVALLEP
ncbi:MAG: DUF3341 domain-containing protein [Planctomycetota bacterium]|nr:DUF3341 domain-containing protein [Planctomycetota bacterium]